MMQDQLQRLVELWDLSLDAGLDKVAESELSALLSDAPLVERFSERQARLSPGEAEGSLGSERLDAAVRKGFLRFRSRATRLWLSLGGLATASVLGLGYVAFQSGGATAPILPVIEHVAPLDQPVKAVSNTLGLPPGYGSRPTRFILSESSETSLSWAASKGRLVVVKVLDSESRVVRTLWTGYAQGTTQSSIWDGRDAQGRPMTPGAYRLVAFAQGEALTASDVELSLKP